MQFNRFALHSVSAVASLVFMAGSAWAVNPFTVRDIRIEGLQRIEPGTVFVSLPVRVGDVYNDEVGSSAIRTLFALGLFKDVRIEVSGDVLVIVVEERPTIAEVDFVGTKEFDKDVLKKALRDVGLADGRPFDKAQLDRAEQELKRQYINRSLYAADVVTTVTPIDRNRVNLTFTVTEGEPAKISEIRIVGNQVFNESTLRGLFDLDTGGWLSWYTKADRYSRAKLNADIETLRSYYLTRGYLEFKVDSTQVAILPNKTDISITINISEGERFIVSGIKLEGNFLGKDDEFKSLVTIRPGQAFNSEEVAKTTKAFTDYFGNFGYAFAQVQARPDIDRVNNRVALVLQAEPSRRAYVRKINVTGNSRSRDVVVRREFRQFEASWYDADKIKLSRNRVDRLGYFKEVDIETQEVPGSPDQVDLSINVVEKPTGSLSLGAGYSSGDGLGLSFGLKQENAFGSGNSLGVQVNTSKYNRALVFNTTDPYFTPDGVSRTIDVYYRTSSPYQDESYYKLKTSGGSLRFGVPFTETDTVYFGAGVENTTIVEGTLLPTSYRAHIDEYGLSSLAVPLTVGWSRDRRDSALAPNSGRLQRANAEWSPAGDVRYVRATYQFQEFIPLNKQFTAAFNAELGWGASVGNKSYPVFKNFYGGGLGSVRGFEQGSLGPQDSFGTVLGGTRKLNLNAEILSPFPGAGNDRTLRMYAFADAGSVGGPRGVNADAGSLRASVGVGVSWISPVGPLRLAFAKPVKKFEGDKIQTIQFQIGTSF
ncbi:MAG: outer membrane protein assembly factor BamA [Gammaproteobacteria bacterium]|uniref:outer membrane protein assembly factor BamA n=1 Tax=Rhodoferax sp. TaxID=50421 RepID=UPI0017A77D23|nr:outer membrane protein assembly factor BamA [Rhodoferax sp.]MBU3899038.1 outer membrane protein assembly factor BamA [Gammaproteobacteria bacterium]MBA3057662.1 outer membrane protein assembly factor BamA [Rhodoferax sp.]MBU3998256.1 outer membrane protein assembly factor BamA [Gammaproteobacteria bacterium]MBU4018481.1 outer membrane protein assembly factor BamA [Gammaproteobacteria bacterium]MBU4080493.1 outer membrane protein assembly factor BamA [Gammaproteobacteria bacterium]